MGHLKHPQSLLSPSLVKLSNQWLHPMKPMKVSYISSSPRHNPLAKCLPSMINGRNGSMSTCRPGEVAIFGNAMQCHHYPPKFAGFSLGFESQEPAKLHRAQVTSCHCVFGKTMLLSVGFVCKANHRQKRKKKNKASGRLQSNMSMEYSHRLCRRCSHWNNSLFFGDFPNFWCVTYLWMLTTCENPCVKHPSDIFVGLTSGFRLIYMSDLKPDLRPW